MFVQQTEKHSTNTNNWTTRIPGPEGCSRVYGADYNPTFCPGGMECLPDSDYQLGGTCTCPARYAHFRRAPVFDDSETDSFFNYRIDGCRREWGLSWAIILATLTHAIIGTRNGYYFFVTFFQVFKKNVKFNSTFRLLWWSTWGCYYQFAIFAWAQFFRSVVPTLPVSVYTWFWAGHGGYDIAYQVAFLCVYEPLYSWVDLIFKTKKLTKTTTMAAKVYMVFLAVSYIIGQGVRLFKLSKSSTITQMIVLSIQTANVYIGGETISRVLCGDENDTANPNWKAATVIRQTYKGTMLCWIMHAIGLFLLSWAWVVSLANPFHHLMWTWYTFSLSMVGVIQLRYVVFGFRKHLDPSLSTRVNEYFGFSAVGINSMICGRCSTSSAESKASSAFVAE